MSELNALTGHSMSRLGHYSSKCWGGYVAASQSNKSGCECKESWKIKRWSQMRSNSSCCGPRRVLGFSEPSLGRTALKRLKIKWKLSFETLNLLSFSSPFLFPLLFLDFGPIFVYSNFAYLSITSHSSSRWRAGRSKLQSKQTPKLFDSDRQNKHLCNVRMYLSTYLRIYLCTAFMNCIYVCMYVRMYCSVV